MKKTELRRYARLIAVTGAHIQKGQQVIINADLDQPEFVYMLTDECYKAGAAKVMVEWNYPALDRLHYRHRSIRTLEKMEQWEVEKIKWRADTLPCFIYLESSDPDGLRGVNQTKMARARQARYKIIKPYSDAMEGKYQWCIAAVPGEGWAKKVYPELSKHQAVEKLWQAILSASRVTDDPIAAWREHDDDLAARCEYLNALGIEELIYRASNGTDLVVAAKIHYEPFGLYGNGVTSLDQVKEGATIIVPADDSNETRALLLLAQEGLITLADGANATDGVTTLDIVDDHGYNVTAVQAETVPAQLQNSDAGTLAVINGNYALAAGLHIEDALATEDASGDAAQTYANVIAVRSGDENSAKIQALVKALQSDAVKQYISDTYNGAVVAIF